MGPHLQLQTLLQCDSSHKIPAPPSIADAHLRQTVAHRHRRLALLLSESQEQEPNNQSHYLALTALHHLHHSQPKKQSLQNQKKYVKK